MTGQSGLSRGVNSPPVGHGDGLCLAKLPMKEFSPPSDSPHLPLNIVILMLFAGTALPGTPALPSTAQPSTAALPLRTPPLLAASFPSASAIIDIFHLTGSVFPSLSC